MASLLPVDDERQWESFRDPVTDRTVIRPARLPVEPIQAPVAVQEPEPPSIIESALASIADKIKSFAQYDRKLTEDVGYIARNLLTNPDPEFVEAGKKGWAKLSGADGERHKTWPEQMTVDAITAPHTAMTKGATTEELIKPALDVSGLAGTGGLAGGVGSGVALGSTPMLRPALKYGEKLYKGKEGQQHLDVLPKELQSEFTRQAMSGEDISHFNFGFVNHKGQFLDREAALKYAIENGLASPHDAKFGALTSTMFNDNRAGTALAAMTKSEKPFYSALERAVESLSQSKASGDQWLATLANKAGIKPEEVEFSGLGSFLKGKGNVTKQEVQEYLKSNQVELGDVWNVAKDSVKPDKIATDKFQADWDKAVAIKRELQDDAQRIMRKAVGEVTPEDHAKVQKYRANETEMNFLHSVMIDDTLKRMGVSKNEPKYSKWQLPGGENYRELLVTLPVKDANAVQALEVKINSGTANLAERQKYAELTESGNWPKRYQSSHWNEPNPLVHMRMNDRTIDGKKSLHLEEIQSDWHQEGRKKGYASSGDKAKFDELDKAAELARSDLGFEAERTAKEAIGSSYAKFLQSNPSQNDRLAAQAKIAEVRKNDKAYQEASQNVQNVTRERDSFNPVSKVPDAPFKKNWHELALKRAVREAAENGYDRLSWTPGEAQAARYDLSKHITDMKVVRGANSNQYSINATLKGRNEPMRLADNIPESELANHVGKEMAEKIVNDINSAYSDRWGVKNRASGNWSKRFSSKEEAKAYQETLPESVRSKTDVLEMTPKYSAEYSGLDLKTGGEGMKGFYDKIVPKSIEKLTGQKVQQSKVAMPPKDDFTRRDGNGRPVKEFKDEPVFYIDITPELKAKALKGFPLFSTAPGPITGVNNE